MATSNVSIANRALQKLGAKRIESLSQDHPNARSLNTAFEPVRNALIRKYPWSFAIARASIAADADDTLWGNLKRYAKPADFGRLLRDDESGVRVDWKIEGRYIVTADASPLEFRYISIVTDPTMFDPCFVELFSTVLAMEVCEDVTGSTGKLESLKGTYARELADAKNADAFETGAQDSLEDDWLIAMD
jgi:hypothetical protein